MQTKARGVDPATSNRQYSQEELAVLQLADEYKQRNGRRFLTITEMLGIVKEAGYKRVGLPACGVSG